MEASRLIDKKYWSQFIQADYKDSVDESVQNQKAKIKHDGQKFEDLVEDLLNLEYGNITWERTKTTHDGNKDFRGFSAEKKVWAECKNYKTKIDLKTLAATLVMAEIQDINSVFFFCYSEINNNTKTKLNSFAVSTKKNIYFFDGIVLDQLILKYRETILPKYFPEFYENIKDKPLFPVAYKPTALCYVERSPFFNGVSDFDMQTLPELQNLKFGEVIGIHIIIINTNLEKTVKSSIELVFSKEERFFEVLNKKEEKRGKILYDDIELSAGTTKRTTLYLRLQSRVSKVTLPQIICKCEGKRIATFTFPTIGTLQTRQTALLGRNYIEKKEYLCKACMNQKKLSIIYIYGSSGTGKSRMVSECSMEFVANGYRVLKLTNSNHNQHSTYTMLKELIFSLYGFNDELIEYVVQNSYDELEKYGGVSKEVLKIIKTIYDNRYSLLQIKNSEYTAIYEKMAKEKYFIIIDDIQYWDDYAVSFLKDFYTYGLNMQRKCNAVIAIAANTDVLYNQHTIEFLSDLNSQNEDFDKNIFSYNVTGFENISQSYMFLKEILGIEDDFEEVNELTAFSQKPKYIAEAANYLLDKKAIELVSNKVIIADKEFFKASLRTLPKSLNSLLTKRWNLYLKETGSNDDDYEKIISNILFLGSTEIYNSSLNMKYQKEIENLYRYGFLKKLEYKDSTYVFEHDTTRFFFQNHYKNWFETVISYFDDSHAALTKVKSLKYICELYNIEKITLENYKSYTDLDISDNLKYKINKHILVSVLEHGTDNVSIIVQDVLCKTREQFGEKSAEILYKLFETIYDFNSGLLTCKEYCTLLMAYAENQVKLKSTEKAINLYDNVLAIIKKADFEESKYFKAQIYNRYFVCGRIGGSIQQYKEKWTLSMELSLANGFWDIYVENYFDKAQSYFLDTQLIPEAVKALQKGCSEYQKHFPKGMKGQYLYRCIQLGFLQKNYVSLKNTIWKYEEEILSDDEIEFKLFFRIQFLVFKIMLGLIKEYTYSDFEMIHMLEQLNMFQTMQNGLQLYRYFYLSAKYYSQKGDWGKAYLLYQKTFDNLQQNKCTEEITLQKNVIAQDMVINFRKRKFPFKQYDMSIFEQAVKESYFKDVMLCPDEEFEKIYDDYIPQAPIFNEETKEGYLLF
jgi:hypothetical protein